MIDLNKDFIEGKLCEKGYLKERWDQSKGDLVRIFTDKGEKRIKEILKTKEGKKDFVMICKGLLKRKKWN